MAAKIRICFVCLGNICRSPTAEAAFSNLVEEQGLADRFEIDSAGTGGWHIGELAHPDARAAARDRGIEITSRSRQWVAEDFHRFDYVVAMDRSNLEDLKRLADHGEDLDKISLFRDFSALDPQGSDVPDPYYEGGFGRVFEICEEAAKGLLDYLCQKHSLKT